MARGDRTGVKLGDRSGRGEDRFYAVTATSVTAQVQFLRLAPVRPALVRDPSGFDRSANMGKACPKKGGGRTHTRSSPWAGRVCWYNGVCLHPLHASDSSFAINMLRSSFNVHRCAFKSSTAKWNRHSASPRDPGVMFNRRLVPCRENIFHLLC